MSMGGRQKAGSWSAGWLWFAWLAITATAVIVSVAYLDRPIAGLVESLIGRFSFVDRFTETPSFFDPLALLVFGWFLLRRIMARPFGRLDMAFLLADASLILADIIKSKLKYIFGRTWPKYEYPSFVYEGAYGFHPFRPEHAFQSFPSGHVTAVWALLSVFWLFFPRFRPLFATAGTGFALLLVATNYHFLADVIAGAYVGASTGLLVVSVWERWGTRFLPRRLGAVASKST